MIEPVLLQRMQTRPVVVLTGARQTGKTALVRRLFPQHAYVRLDLPSEAEQAEREHARFLERHQTPLVIDEVQRCRDQSLDGRTVALCPRSVRRGDAA